MPDKQQAHAGAILSVEHKKGKSPRITIDTGGSAVSLNLTDDDLILLAECGYSVTSFQADHIFPEFERPYIRVLNGRVESVLNMEREAYVNHAGEAVMDIPKAIEVSKDNTTFEKLKSQFDALMLKNREGIPDDPECEGRADAIAVIESIKHIHNNLQQNLGKMMLIAFWDMRASGLFMRLPGSPETVADAIRVFDGQWNDMDYILRLARITDRILPEVEAARKRGTPFTNPNTKKPLTVEDLIMGDGLVKKLAMHSDHFSKLIDRDSKQTFLAAIVTKSASEVAALKDKQQAITVAAVSQTPVKVKQTDAGEGMYKLEFTVDEAQLHAIQRLLKPLVGGDWEL